MHVAEPASNMRSRGFTLIEMLAALVIIALGMLGVIEAIGQTASNGTRMRDRTLAHWVAMNRLTQTRLEPRPPEIAKTSDEVEMAGRRWRWTMEVTETPVESMRRIDVYVTDADTGDDRPLASVTGFYGSAVAARGAPILWGAAPRAPRGPGEPPADDSDGARDGDTEGTSPDADENAMLDGAGVNR